MEQAISISYEEVAHHEAGHAVAAVLSRLQIARVAIFLEGDLGGHVVLPRARPTSRALVVRGPDGGFLRNPRLDAPLRKTSDRVVKELKFTLGGCAAQALFLDPGPLESVEHYAGVADSAMHALIDQGLSGYEPNDDSIARELAGKLPGEEFIDVIIYEIMRETVALLSRPPHWAAVKTLASALLREKCISGRRARAIVLEAVEQATMEQPVMSLEDRV